MCGTYAMSDRAERSIVRSDHGRIAVTLVPRSENFTSRTARWSANHRRAAVLGWLVFVIVAFLVGSAAGMATLTGSEGENGQ